MIFTFIPSIGPQFYLPVEQTIVPDGFLFEKLMRIITTYAESETGAFPSSHVGIAVIISYLFLSSRKFNISVFYM